MVVTKSGGGAAVLAPGQADGQVDVSITRKKRRLNMEYDSLLDRVGALREEMGLLESRYGGLFCSR